MRSNTARSSRLKKIEAYINWTFLLALFGNMGFNFKRRREPFGPDLALLSESLSDLFSRSEFDFRLPATFDFLGNFEFKILPESLSEWLSESILSRFGIEPELLGFCSDVTKFDAAVVCWSWFYLNISKISKMHFWNDLVATHRGI